MRLCSLWSLGEARLCPFRNLLCAPEQTQDQDPLFLMKTVNGSNLDLTGPRAD